MHYIKLLFLLAVTFMLNSCGSSSGNSNPPVENETLKVACVGDSITAGTGLDDPVNESYPAQLSNTSSRGRSQCKNLYFGYRDLRDHR